jgi:post-segregation antitoxin (ccd killing protein)
MKGIFYFVLLLAALQAQLVNSQNIAVNTTGAAAASTNMFEVTQTGTAANTVAVYAGHTGAIAGTGYGLFSTKTGASTTNIGGYFNASGGTNNYAIIVPPGGGRVGIGTLTPTNTLHIYEATGVTPSATNGTIFLEHGNSGGQSSIVFKSTVNPNSDYGYIKYADDGSGNGSSTENSLLEIGVQNDDVPNGAFQDDIALMPSGNLGIGTTAPNARLHVFAGVTTTNTIVNAIGSINDYLQYNIQNTSTGTQAQSGYSATADNGTATTGFAWMGINNSAFNYPTAYNIGGANDVSFLGSGQDMYIANAHNTKSIIFSTGKSTTPFFNERMRITNAGYVGIGTATPTNTLHIYEATGVTASANNGTIFLEHGNSGGQSSIVFKSTVNPNSDYAYIKYSDDGSGNGSTNENSLLEIGVQNDDVPNGTFQDDIALMPSGNLGIGTAAPNARLHVFAGVTTTNTIVNAIGSINDYLQYNIQNTSTGTQAQSGYSATADNGSATTGFAWIGINNSAFNYPTAYNIGGANDVSFLGSGQDMYIANAHNTKSIIFSTGKAASPFFNERMRITNAGYVGIGTNSPAYPLDISATVSTAISGYGFLNSGGTAGFVPGTSGTNNFSARFSGRIISPEFNAQSDARIKDVKGVSNAVNDLSILNKLRITDYEMKDKVQWGHRKFKKIIAQELELVFPQAVSTSIGFVPNIYQLASCFEKTNAGYCFHFDKPFSINAGAKKIRLITDAGNSDLEVISIPDSKTLVFKADSSNFTEGANVFVYGEEVQDFRVVDYDALTTLNISATQELSRQLELLRSENQKLKEENVSFKTDIAKIQAQLGLNLKATITAKK